jgi:hypothetical protein
MPHKKGTKELDLDSVTRSSVKLDLAKPRMSRSTKIAELKAYDASSRTAQHNVAGNRRQNNTFFAPEQTGKGTDHVEGPERRYRDLRIENVLTDEQGDKVRLKKGAQVEITVSTELSTSPASKTKDH